MQLTRVNLWNKWMKNGRRPARPVTRFKADKPMKLRGEVTTGTQIDSDVVCIPQMMDMLACFKDNEFNQSKCGPQIEAFQKCYDSYVTQKEMKKSGTDNKEPTPGQMKLTKDQLNVLLRRWPQPT